MIERGEGACIHGSTCIASDERSEFCNMFHCPRYQVRDDLKGNPSYDLEAIKKLNKKGKSNGKL